MFGVPAIIKTLNIIEALAELSTDIAVIYQEDLPAIPTNINLTEI